MKPMFSYVETYSKFYLHQRGKPISIAEFDSDLISEQFMKWLVALLNENYDKFSAGRSEKLIKEMGF